MLPKVQVGTIYTTPKIPLFPRFFRTFLVPSLGAAPMEAGTGRAEVGEIMGISWQHG